MKVTPLWGALLIMNLTACNPRSGDRGPGSPRNEVVRQSPTTQSAQPSSGAEPGPPGFRAGAYSGRVIRRYIDAETSRVPLEELMKLGSEACDELLRFEIDRSYMRRYDRAGWEAFKREQQLDDLEIPRGSEVDIGLLVVARDGRLGVIAGNSPVALARSAEEPSSLVALARFSGSQVAGDWHAFHKGASSGVAFRFTPREDSGLYSMRSMSISNAVAEGMGDNVLFYYGLNVFPGRVVVELAVLYWRGYLDGRARVSLWPSEEFRVIFQEKTRRDFDGDRRAFESYLLGLASFLSQDDPLSPAR